jgi:hypothetical protein
MIACLCNVSLRILQRKNLQIGEEIILEVLRFSHGDGSRLARGSDKKDKWQSSVADAHNV